MCTVIVVQISCPIFKPWAAIDDKTACSIKKANDGWIIDVLVQSCQKVCLAKFFYPHIGVTAWLQLRELCRMRTFQSIRQGRLRRSTDDQ